MKKNYKRKKSSKEKRVLLLSMACAVTLVAGSTFAWFTSKDEVTNRLSATAKYGVTIAEDFTPPENWIPGQKIDKKVGVVNTGNVDAFARVWLEGEMKVIARVAAGAADTMTTGAGTWDSAATDKINAAQLVTTTTTDNYLRVLDKAAASTGSYNEVQSMQAGGWLAYAPSGCEWQYIEKATSTDPAVISSDTTVTAGSGTTTATSTFVAAGTYGCAIDAASFKPKTTGLYLFRRNADVNTLDSDKNVYYSGYYYVAGIGYGDGTYYTLNTETDGTGKTVYAAHTDAAGTKIFTHSDSTTGITLASGSTTDKLQEPDVANVKLFLAKKSVIKNADLTWTYDSTSGSEKFTVSPINGTTGDGIDITVTLANIGNGTATDKWQAIQKGTSATTFYYTNDIEESATTSKLVDSVTMNNTVTADDYVAFDFDLNVKMDSIQITNDSSGKETFETVSSSWGSLDGASGAHLTSTNVTYSGNELSILNWAVDS